MAPPKQRPEDSGKVRIRFIEVEIEGSNQTLLDGIRQVTAAMPPHRMVVREVPPPASNKTLAAAPHGGEPRAENGVGEHSDGASPPSQVAPDDSPASAKAPRSPRPAAKPPQLSTDLRLDEQPTPLKEFCESTAVTATSSITDKTIVVATWLKEHRSRNEITAGDLYTCCKFMDWDPPSDTTSPMRNLKRDNKMNSSEQGKFSLTILGEKHFRELRKQ